MLTLDMEQRCRALMSRLNGHAVAYRYLRPLCMGRSPRLRAHPVRRTGGGQQFRSISREQTACMAHRAPVLHAPLRCVQALEQQLKASREAVRESERQLRQEQREGDRLRLALRERLAHARDTPSRALLGSQAPVTDGMARVLEGQGACQGAEGSGSGRGVTDGKGNGSRGLGAGGEHEGSVGAGAGVESVGAADAAGDWNRAEAAQRGAGAEGAAVEAKPAQGDAGGSAGHAERQGGEQAEVQVGNGVWGRWTGRGAVIPCSLCRLPCLSLPHQCENDRAIACTVKRHRKVG